MPETPPVFKDQLDQDRTSGSMSRVQNYRLTKNTTRTACSCLAPPPCSCTPCTAYDAHCTAVPPSSQTNYSISELAAPSLLPARLLLPLQQQRGQLRLLRLVQDRAVLSTPLYHVDNRLEARAREAEGDWKTQWLTVMLRLERSWTVIAFAVRLTVVRSICSSDPFLAQRQEGRKSWICSVDQVQSFAVSKRKMTPLVHLTVEIARCYRYCPGNCLQA